ncbi:iron uptake porin [Hassallia byssoidea VB512170]|uniref:Iron uptake porin n=1 Tax=Hassallia byssoidea VB512170 TaxID=1304833 RepID=A0A846H6M1_9CYAN|nr:iron uptake porin [Hassalia byssoidea]NEU72324.1 iron uptake porin [Hassalia byssoidea VB512170]
MSSFLALSLWIAPILLFASVVTAQTASANSVLEATHQVQLDTQLAQSQTEDNLVSETPIVPVKDISSEQNRQINDESNQDPYIMDQVTSVSQLSDVQPTDWAFQALQSLVERYGCIAGYPNGTFRGNRAMTRYEFAAGLNACLNRVQELIATSTADLVTKEDLGTLQRLQQEYADGLAELRGRIDPLEARIAVVESQQFSTTTNLTGDAIFSIGGVFGGDRALNSDQLNEINNPSITAAQRNTARASAYGPSGSKLQDNAVFSDRVRLIFDSSFFGKDRLRILLKANNTIPFNSPVTGTNMTRLSYDTTVRQENTIDIGKIFYNFPVGDKLSVTVDAIGGSFFDNFNTVNSLFAAAPTGALSRFGRFSPIYRASNTGLAVGLGSGVSAVLKLNDTFTLSAGYLARNGNEPGVNRGLFDGSYGALTQLAIQPNKDATIALTYAHSYFSGVVNGVVTGDVNVSGSEGSAFAATPFGNNIATSANHYGLQTSYRFNPKFVLSGWVGYTQATAEIASGNNPARNNVNRGDKADIWNWAVTLGFPDLGKKGNLAGIIFGQPPKVTSNDYGPSTFTPTATNRIVDRRTDSDTSYHLEALYRYQVNSNLSITPGFIIIFNPEHNSNNDTIYEGIIRSTFRF